MLTSFPFLPNKISKAIYQCGECRFGLRPDGMQGDNNTSTDLPITYFQSLGKKRNRGLGRRSHIMHGLGRAANRGWGGLILSEAPESAGSTSLAPNSPTPLRLALKPNNPRPSNKPLVAGLFPCFSWRKSLQTCHGFGPELRIGIVELAHPIASRFASIQRPLVFGRLLGGDAVTHAGLPAVAGPRWMCSAFSGFHRLFATPTAPSAWPRRNFFQNPSRLEECLSTSWIDLL